MRKLFYVLTCVIAMFILGNRAIAQELIANVSSYNNANPNDKDGVYLVGTAVTVVVTASNARADLQGTISIRSISTGYNFTNRTLENIGAGAYQYIWNTTNLSPAGDYKVSVRLRDTSGKESLNESTNIELYTSTALLRSVDSQDSSVPEDNDEIYHAEQKIRIIVGYTTGQKLTGTAEINSESTKYKSRNYGLQTGANNTLEFIWDTQGLKEADDYLVYVTLKDDVGREVSDRSLVITVDNTPPRILTVGSRDRDDITDNDGIYHAGQIIVIDAQTAVKESSLKSTVQVKSDSVRYDSGPQRMTYQGEGLWRFLWTTTGLNPAIDYIVTVKFQDQAALETQDSSLRMEIDNTPPQNGKVVINKGDVYATSRPVAIAISADGASRMYVSGDVVDDIFTFEWISYAESLTVELTRGDGIKRISTRFMDNARNQSSAVEDTIILDEEPPAIKSVTSYDEADKLDNDNIYHASQIIVIEVEVSEELPELKGTLSINSAIARYNSGLQTLTNAGQGKYTYKWNTTGLLEAADYMVSVSLEDPSKRKATNSSLRINIDNTPPSKGEVKINDGEAVTESRSITLTLSASGDPREAFIEGDLVDDTNTFQWIPYVERVVVNLTDVDGEKKVKVRFRNAARNIGGVVSASIILDRKSPTSASIIIEDNAQYTTTRNVNLKLKAENAEKMLIDGDVMDDELTFDYISYREQLSVTLSPGDGEKSVGVVFINAVGIKSDRVQDNIILDTRKPVIASMDSSDLDDPRDNDEIYRPGQLIKVIVTAGAGEAKLDAMIRIRSQKAAYDTGEQKMSVGIDRMSFSYIWDTSGLQDSDDYVVSVQLTDAAGHETESSDLKIAIDSLPPSRGQLIINDGDATTESRTVRLKISAINAVTMFISGDVISDSNTFQWISYRTILTANLSGEDGLKTVYVKFRDGAGNESTNITDTISLDRKSPYELGIVIAVTESGAIAGKADKFATSQKVFLGLSAKNSVEMYVSGDVVKDDNTFEWIKYSSRLSVSLTKNDGEKAVHAKFRNQLGIESEPVEGSIILDTSAPKVTFISFQDAQDKNDNDGWYHPGEPVRIIFEVIDANEPEAKINIRSDNIGYDSGMLEPDTRSPISNQTWKFEYIWDTKDMDAATDFTVNISLKDAAGWTSTSKPETLVLDDRPPTNPKVNVNRGARRTASRIVTIEASADDATEMLIAGDVRDDDNTFQWIPVKNSMTVILSSGEGLKDIDVRFRDLAENETSVLNASIILSQSPPQIERVDSWDTSDSSDNDEKYHAGELVKLALKAKARSDAPMIETGLLAKLLVVSSDEKYKSGDKEAREESNGWYTFIYDTKGLAEGTYQIKWNISDGVGHVSEDSSLKITIDNTPPKNPEIKINNGSESTRYRSVTLSLQATNASWVFIDGDVVEDKTATFNWIYLTPDMNITVKLSAGDGKKWVQAKFKDDADNTTDTISSQIILDTVGPEVVSVKINDGEEYTNSTEVTIDISAKDAIEMYINGDVSDGDNTRQWFTYQEKVSVKLTEEDGKKNIGVEFKDAVGNFSEKFTATIVLDTKPPKVDSVKSANTKNPADDDGRYLAGTQVKITISVDKTDTAEKRSRVKATIQITSTASGYVSGVQKMENEGNEGNDTHTYLWDTSFLQAADDYTAKIELKDEAGNCAADESLVMAIHDKPIEQKVAINGEEEITTSQSIEIVIAADNVAEMYITGDVIDDSNTFDWIKFAASKELKLTPGDGIKKVKVAFRDSRSRGLGEAEATIKLDQTPPAIKDVKTSKETYRADDKVEITIKAGGDESGLEGTVQIRSRSTEYDSGPQRTTSRDGEYSYTWDTEGLKEGDDYQVEAILTDEAGWTTRDYRRTIAIDNTPPEGGELIVNGSQLFTQRRSVEITFVAPKDTEEIFIEGDLVRDSNTFQWIDVKKFTRKLMVNLSVGDGEKKIKAKFKDEAGNETEPIEKTIILNESPPVITAVDSWDEDVPTDNDEIYHAGQRVKITIKVDDREKLSSKDKREPLPSISLEAWVRITSEKTGYDSRLLTAVRGSSDEKNPVAEFSAVWVTVSMSEAPDYLVEATVQDSYGQRTSDDSLNITIDNTPPDPPIISTEGNQETTNSRKVYIKLNAEKLSEDAVDMMFEGDVSESLNARKWIQVVDTKEVELSDGDGKKVIIVKVRDSAGNISKLASVTIALDRANPSSPSIIINNKAEYTESQQVTLTLSSVNAREMYISGNVVKEDRTYKWVPFQQEYKVRLTEGEGKKTVFVIFRNGAENISKEVSTEIVLDYTPPGIEDIEAFDALDEEDDDLVFHAGQGIMFQVTAKDNESGLDAFVIIKDSGDQQEGTAGTSFDTGRQSMSDAGGGIYRYTWDTTGIADGKYSCQVILEDIAEQSATDKVEIVIDNKGPINPSITINTDKQYLDTRTVEVVLGADGNPVEVFIAGDVINDDQTFEWIEFSPDKYENALTGKMKVSLNLRGSDGEKKVTVKFRDNARSESNEAEAKVILDIKRPELTKTCRIIQTEDDPPRAFLALQFDEPIKKVEPKDFLVILRDKSDSKRFMHVDGTTSEPVLSKDVVVLEMPVEKLDEIKQWRPLTFAYSYIQAEISENGVFDLSDKGNKSNESSPSDVYFVTPVSSIQVAVEPTSFSPNDDEVKDRITITYIPARTSDVTVRITDWQKETVKEWFVEDQLGGLLYSVEWNGKKPDGSAYPDGEYTAIIMSSEVQAAGSAYGIKSRFTIDNSAPQIVDVRPSEGSRVPAKFGATIRIVDTPDTGDMESVYVTVFGDIETKFPMTKSEAEGEYVVPITSQLLLPQGKQDVTFHAIDTAGNEAERTVSYTVVKEAEAGFILMNYPNPFPPGNNTNIRYSLPEDARSGKFVIYDAGGDMVFFKDLLSSELEYGEHTFQWDGRDVFGDILARGVYFCRLLVNMETREGIKIHKIAIR